MTSFLKGIFVGLLGPVSVRAVHADSFSLQQRFRVVKLLISSFEDAGTLQNWLYSQALREQMGPRLQTLPLAIDL